MGLFAVIRVPGSGPPALAGPPNVFATKAAALARIAEIERDHLKAHHTFLDVVEVEEPVFKSLSDIGILI